jgi:hypothetical protein
MFTAVAGGRLVAVVMMWVVGGGGLSFDQRGPIRMTVLTVRRLLFPGGCISLTVQAESYRSTPEYLFDPAGRWVSSFKHDDAVPEP